MKCLIFKLGFHFIAYILRGLQKSKTHTYQGCLPARRLDKSCLSQKIIAVKNWDKFKFNVNNGLTVVIYGHHTQAALRQSLSSSSEIHVTQKLVEKKKLWKKVAGRRITLLLNVKPANWKCLWKFGYSLDTLGGSVQKKKVHYPQIHRDNFTYSWHYYSEFHG